MKAKVGIGIILSCVFIFVVFKLNQFNKFKLDVIYSGNSVINYAGNNPNESDYLSRNEAVDKAAEAVTDILKDDIDLNNMTEYVTLNSEEGRLIWNIELVNNTNESYLIDMDADSGEILFVEQVNGNDNEKNDYGNVIKKQDLINGKNIINSVKPYLKVNIDFNKHPTFMYKDYNDNLKLIYDTKGTQVQFVINLKTNKIIKYSLTQNIKIVGNENIQSDKVAKGRK
ncbi:PepSY domain-containing protein [uncultured Clostridium sp.]|uniref:PepSY domain-containing protein n=1 Tax=uncultured Clostridium sp. TaxID=59620 RepID=UPI0026113C22|nr:PepSY domain-containing protein [uncultured Clostridium sp.]